jgi:hypothetical protein
MAMGAGQVLAPMGPPYMTTGRMTFQRLPGHRAPHARHAWAYHHGAPHWPYMGL